MVIQKIGLDRISLVINSENIVVDTKKVVGLQKGEGTMVYDLATNKKIEIAVLNRKIRGAGIGEVDTDAIVVRNNNFDKNKFDIVVNGAKLLYGTNERNIEGLALERLAEEVACKLASEGIYIDMSKATIGSVEINYNIDDKKLYDVFELIAKANMYEGFKAYKVEVKDGIQTVKIKKDKYELKIYRKTEQLKETGKLVDSGNLVRFEVSTNVNSEKAKFLGDNMTLESLVENWDKAMAWYLRCIDLTINKPIDKYITEVEGLIIASMRSGKKPSEVATGLLLNNNLLDFEIFSNAVKKHYKQNKKGSPSSVLKGIRKKLEKANSERFKSMTGNLEKLEEFYKEIGLKSN